MMNVAGVICPDMLVPALERVVLPHCWIGMVRYPYCTEWRHANTMSDEHDETPADSTDFFRFDVLRELLQLIGQTDVSELLLEHNGNRIHIKRAGGPASAAPRNEPPPRAEATGPAVPRAPGWMTTISSMPPPVTSSGGAPSVNAAHTLKAPMVGTFRAAPSPTEPPFVQEGDELAAGSPVCIIEALGLMNRIDADMAGRVQRILVQDGQSVEYGQPLMLLEPV
jgi:acetyl-CoA carboxylase biotin carboxyl carrier protein